MRRILVIGIGPGSPDFVTMQAVEAMNRADVFFLPDKGGEKAELRTLRLEILRRFVRRAEPAVVDVVIPERARTERYRDDVDAWHAAVAAAYRARIEEHLAEGRTGALLVWGDPTLYDSAIRLVERLADSGLALDWEVIPGISSVQVLAARHRIPLNRIGEPVTLTTGRQLAEELPATDSVVLLDGAEGFLRPGIEDLELFWGAYLGMADEVLISGRAGDVAATIRDTRRRLRAEKGWIMDAYLLRRPPEDASPRSSPGSRQDESRQDEGRQDEG